VKLRYLYLIAGCSLLTSLSANAQVTIWTYHNNNHRDGANLNETILNPTNVNSTIFGRLFSYTLDGYAYAQPLFIPNLAITGRGTHDVLFVATEHNTVYAFDADNAGPGGGLLWKSNLGVAAVSTIPGVFTNKDFGTRYNNNAYTDIEPEVGITGTPVIDTNSGTLYVDVFTGESSGGVTNYFHRVHALNIADGTERSFSPATIAVSVPGTGLDSVGGRVTFNPKQENQRPALTLAGGVLYVAFAAYADTDPYHGWVIGYNASNLAQLTNCIFNTTPNSSIAVYGTNAGEGGIWMGGGGLAVDDNTNLYFEIGNGVFNVTDNSGNTEYGDSFMKLSTSNGLAVADYFTPYNQANLAQNDTDLGSGGLLILPDQPGTFPRLLLGAGKAGDIYLINRDQFTTNNNHYDPTNTLDFVAGIVRGKIDASFDTPAYFNEQIYYGGSGDNLKIFTLANGILSAGPVNNSSRSFSFPGATPSISAQGTSNGVLWAVAMGAPAVLVAYNATNLSTELYNSGQAAGNRDQLANGAKFAVPTVADGEVFVGGASSVSVFGLLAGTLAFSSPAYSVQASGTNATITVNRLGGTNGAVHVSYATVAGGTAAAGADYTGVSGTLNWTNGDVAAKTFTVPILGNPQVQSNVTVNLALSGPSSSSALGVQSTAAITIVEPPIDTWKLAYFGANANNPAIAGDSADPQHDGIVNLMAYAYAFNPLLTQANPFTGHLAGNQFQLVFPRNTTASDITYNIQSSVDLNVWSNLLTYAAASGWGTNVPGAAVSESAANGLPPVQYVNVTATTSTNVKGNAANQFLRLKIDH
jgi:Calx-beta domain